MNANAIIRLYPKRGRFGHIRYHKNRNGFGNPPDIDLGHGLTLLIDSPTRGLPILPRDGRAPGALDFEFCKDQYELSKTSKNPQKTVSLSSFLFVVPFVDTAGTKQA
jgi:hypothetical protein